MKNILVIGAAGHQGRPVAEQLMAAGYKVRAMVRDASIAAAIAATARGPASRIISSVWTSSTLQMRLGAWAAKAVAATTSTGSKMVQPWLFSRGSVGI